MTGLSTRSPTRPVNRTDAASRRFFQVAGGSGAYPFHPAEIHDGVNDQTETRNTRSSPRRRCFMN